MASHSCMFGGLGGVELLLIALMLLVFFGPQRLGEFGRALGEALREYSRAKAGIGSEGGAVGAGSGGGGSSGSDGSGATGSRSGSGGGSGSSGTGHRGGAVSSLEGRSFGGGPDFPVGTPLEPSEEERVRAAALRLGLDIKGRTVEELKVMIIAQLEGPVAAE